MLRIRALRDLFFRRCVFGALTPLLLSPHPSTHEVSKSRDLQISFIIFKPEERVLKLLFIFFLFLLKTSLLLLKFHLVLVVLQLSSRAKPCLRSVIKTIWRKYMKKILGLFCAMLALSACSSFSSNGGLFGGSECEAKEARDFMANAEDRVFFALDSSALTSNAQEVLDTQVNWLTAKRHNKTNVIVQGYCDERGTREYNLALGERRANAVKEYLVSHGVDADRISTISYGKERPAVLGSNEAAWAQNRRAVTVVRTSDM